MRFVSKSTNLMLVLKPGFPGNHLTGTTAISGVYVKFQNGIVDVKEPALIEMMMNHKGYNIDYICAEEEGKDPFEYLRNDSEPAHVLTEIKYGHAEKSVGTPRKTKLSPEIKALLQEEALKMAKEMLPGMMKEVLTNMRDASTTTKENVDREEETFNKKEEPSGEDEGTVTSKESVAPKSSFCDSCSSKGVRHMKDCPRGKKE